jgi:hypothetical protein
MPSVAGLSGVGGLTAEGMSALGTMGAAGAGMGMGTTGPLGALSGAGNLATTNLANTAGLSGAGVGAGVAGATMPAGATTAASTISRLLKDNLGIDVGADTIGLLGQGLGAGLGMLGSSQQSSALKDLQNQMSSQRAPFLNKAVGYLNDPNSFYSSPEATGASDAILRRLSTTYGNPGVSPTAQTMATGALYDRYANTINSLGSLGLSGQGIQADIGKDIVSSSGQPYAIAGNAVGNMTSSNFDINKLFQQALQKQYGLA